MRRLFLAVVLVSSSTLALGESPRPLAAAGTSYFLPTAANTEGLFGAHFRTRVYIRDDSFGNGFGGPLLIVAATPTGFLSATLPVRLTYKSENFLEDIFHYTGGAALSISRVGGSGPFVLRAEVYTDGPAGITTTPVPTLSLSDEVATREPPVTIFSTSLGVSSDPLNRLNVGCANFDSGPATVETRVDTFTGRRAFFSTFVLEAGQWFQTNVPDVAIEPGSIVGFQLLGFSSKMVFCYAVNVNNVSNDGTVIPAVQYAPRQSEN